MQTPTFRTAHLEPGATFVLPLGVKTLEEVIAWIKRGGTSPHSITQRAQLILDGGLPEMVREQLAQEMSIIQCAHLRKYDTTSVDRDGYADTRDEWTLTPEAFAKAVIGTHMVSRYAYVIPGASAKEAAAGFNAFRVRGYQITEDDVFLSKHRRAA